MGKSLVSCFFLRHSVYNQCNTIDSTTDSTTCVNARQTLVTESQHHEMIVQVVTVRLVKTQKSGAVSCLLMHSCSAMDRHMQHSVFHTVAFLAFSCLAISTLASWCRKFMSRIFSVPHSASRQSSASLAWLNAPPQRTSCAVAVNSPKIHLWLVTPNAIVSNAGNPAGYHRHYTSATFRCAVGVSTLCRLLAESVNPHYTLSLRAHSSRGIPESWLLT